MILFEISVVLLLIVFNGLLAMSEMAVVSSRRSRLQNLAKQGGLGAKMALRLLDDPTRFLSTIQIGITLIGILAGAFSGATLADRLGDWFDVFPGVAPYGDTIAISIVVIVITYMSLIVGELVPKRIALGNPERIASLIAPTMQGLSRFASPAVWLLRNSTEFVLKMLWLKETARTTITEDEVRSLIAEGTQAGIFMPQEREMIDGVLRLADRTARTIMTRRAEVAWLDENAGADEIARLLAERPFSRFLVCRETVDYPVGIVRAKDLLRISLENEPIVLSRAMVPPIVVPEQISILRLLDMFRREGRHMAVIVDEYGTTEGVVTPNDILKAIAGDLPERGDGDAAAPSLVRRSDGTWLVDGRLPIDEFEHRIGLSGLQGDGDFHTVAGFVLHRLGHLPTAGESFGFRGARFEVVDMDGRRIDKVLYVPVPDETRGSDNL
jgi:putative hemolysin